MRDDKEKKHGSHLFHIQISLKVVITFFVFTLFLFPIFTPITLGDQDPKDSFIIEFTAPSIMCQLNPLIENSNNFSILKTMITNLSKNASEFQQRAISQISQLINQKLIVSDITQYKLLFNGMRIKNISDSIVKRIESLPFVKQVEKDKIVSKTDICSVSSFQNVNNNFNTSSSDQISISAYSGRNISIAFFDTGIDYTHNALSSSYKGGYDFVNNDEDPFDDNGHGTHVTGITVAHPNDGTNHVFGLAPNASVLSYKVLDEQGQGYTSWFLSAFEHAMDPNQDGFLDDHVDIISISAGNPYGSSTDALSIAARQAVQAGVIVVAAAGNNGPKINTISSPAVAEEVIAVGAAIDENTIAPYSSRGDKDRYIIKPDVVAYGHQINSTWPNNQYETLSGTSMATPYITGVIACMLEHNPNLNPENIRALLHSQAIPLSYNETTEGYGLITKSQIFTLKKIPISSVEISHSIKENNLSITFDINYEQSHLTYSALIKPLDKINDEQNLYIIQKNSTERVIEFSTKTLKKGYYVIQINIIINDTIYREKKIIYLNLNSSDIINIPNYINEGTTFNCIIQNRDTRGMFIFIVPLRTIQCKIGSSATFHAPRILQSNKEKLNGVLYSILPGHTPLITKQSITIHHSIDQSDKTSSPPANNI